MSDTKEDHLSVHVHAALNTYRAKLKNSSNFTSKSIDDYRFSI